MSIQNKTPNYNVFELSGYRPNNRLSNPYFFVVIGSKLSEIIE
jgi:hypothetical protein